VGLPRPLAVVAAAWPAVLVAWAGPVALVVVCRAVEQAAEPLVLGALAVLADSLAPAVLGVLGVLAVRAALAVLRSVTGA